MMSFEHETRQPFSRLRQWGFSCSFFVYRLPVTLPPEDKTTSEMITSSIVTLVQFDEFGRTARLALPNTNKRPRDQTISCY